jgi:hypothetical protein
LALAVGIEGLLCLIGEEKMKEEKSIHKGLVVVVLLAVVSLLPTVSAQDPPVDHEGCIAYAYTKSENHLFLLGQNTSMFGSTLNVVHNCQELEIYVDGFFQASSSTDFSILIEQGIHNITIQSNEFNATFGSVVFYPDRLDWQYEWTIIQESKPQFIDIELAALQTNYAVGIGIFIVWVLATYVYWSLISSYVDRNFIEEVVQ